MPAKYSDLLLIDICSRSLSKLMVSLYLLKRLQNIKMFMGSDVLMDLCGIIETMVTADNIL